MKRGKKRNEETHLKKVEKKWVWLLFLLAGTVQTLKLSCSNHYLPSDFQHNQKEKDKQNRKRMEEIKSPPIENWGEVRLALFLQ